MGGAASWLKSYSQTVKLSYHGDQDNSDNLYVTCEIPRTQHSFLRVS